MAVLKVVPNGRNGSNRKTPSKFTSLYSKGAKTILLKNLFKDILKQFCNVYKCIVMYITYPVL